MKQHKNKDVKGGLTVEVRNGNFEQAFRLFKKKVNRSGIKQELRDRKFFKKPSEMRREALKKAIKREKKRLQAQQDML